MPTDLLEEVVTPVREERQPPSHRVRVRRRRSSHLADVLTTLSVSVPVAYLAWQRGGVNVTDQAVVFGWLLALATVAAFWRRPFGSAVRLPWPVLVISFLPVMQLVPLPGILWQWISSPRQQMLAEFARYGVHPEPAISIYPYATLKEALVLAGCCVLFCLARAVASRSKISHAALLAPLMALAVAEFAVGLQQHLRGQTLDNPVFQFAHGTFVNRDHYAALLEGLLGLALGVVFATVCTRGWKRWFQGRDAVWTVTALAVAAACGLGVVFSFSRMGVIVVTTITLATLATALWRQRLAALLISASVGAGVLLASSAGLRGLPERFGQLIAERGDPFRIAIWLDSLETASQYLWTGSGLGTFAFAFRRSEAYAPLKFIDHAHSEYLELLVELGLPATLLLIGGALYLVIDTGRRARVLDDRRARRLAYGCLLGAAGMLLHSAVDFPLRMPAVAALFAVLLGYARGLSAAKQERAESSAYVEVSRLRIKRIVTVVPAALFTGGFSLVALLLLLGRWDHLDAEVRHERAYAAMMAGKPEEAGALYAEALHANPYAAALWLKRSELAEASGDVQGAVGMARLARRLEPYSVRTEWPLAHLYLRTAELEKAAGHLGLLAAAIPAMDATILDAAWDAGMTPGMISARIVPREAAATGQYLCYLARRQAWEAIVPACQALRCAELTIPPLLLRYAFDKMFEAGQGFEYRRLWELTGALSRNASPKQLSRRATPFSVDAPSIAEPGYGLAWVQHSVAGVSIGSLQDRTGLSALEVHFSRPLDLAYSHLRHDFAVEPLRRYVLEAEVRTEGLTGSEGVRLLIQSPRGAVASSEGVRRTVPWQRVRLSFRSGPSDHVLRLMIARYRSQKLDKYVQGRFLLRKLRVHAVH